MVMVGMVVTAEMAAALNKQRTTVAQDAREGAGAIRASIYAINNYLTRRALRS
jgi:hypothetical protein